MLKEKFCHELQTEAQTACGWPVIGCAIFFHMAGKKFPKYFTRRDQRAVCCAPRAVRRPVTPSTTPVPLRKTARSSRAAIVLAATAAAFRLRLGSGVSLRLHSSRLSVSAPLSPLADRRPKPCQIASAIDAGKFQAHTSPIVANRKRKPSRIKE
jgi:hypothetical protein